METKVNISKAIVRVMQEVKGMEKNSKVGTGNSSYNGTKDQDVKEVFNEALSKNGLCIVPIEIDESTQVDRWEETNNYGTRMKQSVFTKVKTKYMLLHETGESIIIAGYGHGVDSQDKGAGKATTYALKNALLYTFLTPVGKIDDTDTTHSDDITTPVPKQPQAQKPKTPQLPQLKKGTEEWAKIEGFLADGALKSVGQVAKKFTLTKELALEIQSMIDDKSTPPVEEPPKKEPAKEVEPSENASKKEEEESRLPNLTKANFEKTKSGTKPQILKVLAEHRMGSAMRKELEEIVKNMK